MATGDHITELLWQQEEARPMSAEVDMRIHEAIGEMPESEVFFPVRCPICLQESLTGFRISVIADAMESSEIRLYSNCHVISWDASERELDKNMGTCTRCGLRIHEKRVEKWVASMVPRKRPISRSFMPAISRRNSKSRDHTEGLPSRRATLSKGRRCGAGHVHQLRLARRKTRYALPKPVRVALT